MTHIFFLRSLVNKPNTLSIVCVLKGLYRALQLFCREITLQNKKKRIVKLKIHGKLKC